MHVAIVTCANRRMLGALCILKLGNRDKDSENLVLILFLQLVDYTAVGKLLDLLCLNILIYKMGIITPASQGCYMDNYLMCAKSFEDGIC